MNDSKISAVATKDTEQPSTSTNSSSIITCLSTGRTEKPRQVLLATALINIESSTGERQIVRALIDQGSQACFITEATVQLLKLKKRSVHGVISGLGENKTVIAKSTVNFVIRSRLDPSVEIPIEAYVLSSITSYLPEKHVNEINWIELNHLHLADPRFGVSNKIDLLIGAEVYSYILREGVKRDPSGSLIAQNTTLGWIISGVVNAQVNHSTSLHVTTNIVAMHTQINQDEMLRKFWEIEEQTTNFKNTFTEEEERCEEFFKNTTTRTSGGRYVVKLPFRDEDPQCKNHGSREIAETRFKSLEHRLLKNEKLKKEYKDVIDDYLKLGHMRLIKNADKNDAVYLPHHAVIREDKTTTKVRVVFNASEKNKKGISLNDTLMVGPTLQADLRHTVLRWRVHPIVLVADIIKMYRQVQIAKEDAKYQRILWRDDRNKEIEEYELMTVTFGTASAPYLAVKVLQQITYDEGQEYPLAAEVVRNNFYMDDLMVSCSSIDEGVELYKQISELLKKGKFTLQKWNSNSRTLRNKIEQIEQKKLKLIDDSEEDKKQSRLILNTSKIETEIKIDNTIKILGLTWNRDEDCFQYTVNLPPAATPVTKRAIISDISRLFDPLGWIAPTMIIAKIFIQRLWLAGVGWDERLSNELISEWNTYRQTLTELTRIRIPRWVGIKSNTVDVELHGFCDASKFAYAAVVYLRSIDIEGKVHVALLTAKTRVAPIKQVCIPRLELCGAVLLSTLLLEVANVLNISKDKIRAWTDSTIVLAWLNSHPSRWKTFVANRTSEILSNMNSSQWFHVSTKCNPTDLATRGLLPDILADSNMWFLGPEMIREQNIIYEKPTNLNSNLEENVRVHLINNPDQSILEKYSSFNKLLRIVAFCRRFLNKGKNQTIYLRKKEIDEALKCCIRLAQIEAFPVEYAELQKSQAIRLKCSPLRSLCPYLDSNRLIRVSGRLHNAQIDDSAKHPIVLPNKHHLTKLIIADAHHRTLHGGPQLMMNFLRSAYWIIAGKNMIKKHVHEFIVCAKQKAVIKQPLMGSLPSVRCSPARAFLHTGVDYAGPINIRTSKGRGHHAYKGYICLFVCMCTKAIHLELVSDMTAQGFLAAFRRFTARRGHVARLWSDNGTTFVGANKELQQLRSVQESSVPYLETNGTEWHFIPPHAPNFGGLWEAGVKSTKFHLKRVIGDTTLTYEELSALLCQIESCLNSRPLSVISNDVPETPLPLTPGHFLIGEPLINVPELNYENSSVSSLSRWQFIQKTLQNFWRRWSQEYLTTMINRYKWSSNVPEPKIGQIVLVKEDDLPPSRWLLGRIIEKHTGSDNVTRVVTLRTKTSIIKRPTSKLCILPIEN